MNMLILATILISCLHPSIGQAPDLTKPIIVRPAVNSLVSRGGLGRKCLGTFEVTSYNLTENLTRSGDKTKIGIVAVDPAVIPLGTKLFIEGYGPGVASDTGDAIIGRKLDVWLPGHEAKIWGRRKVKVWKE